MVKNVVATVDAEDVKRLIYFRKVVWGCEIARHRALGYRGLARDGVSSTREMIE